MILRVYSYLYHLVLCLFLMGVASLAISSPSKLNLAMLPWTGSDLDDMAALGWSRRTDQHYFGNYWSFSIPFSSVDARRADIDGAGLSDKVLYL